MFHAGIENVYPWTVPFILDGGLSGFRSTIRVQGGKGEVIDLVMDLEVIEIVGEPLLMEILRPQSPEYSRPGTVWAQNRAGE